MLPKIPAGKPDAPRGRNAKSAANGGGPNKSQLDKASSSAALPGIKKLPKAMELALLAMNHDEELFRSTIEMQEGVGHASMYMDWEDERKRHSYAMLRSSSRMLNQLTSSVQDQAQSMNQLLGAVRDTRQDVFSTRERIDKFFDHLDSEERKEMDQLRIDHKHLTITTERQQTILELQQSEIHSLRDQLSRRILRNSVESQQLRQQVNDEIKRVMLDMELLRKQLHERIDGAVLAFQKPTYSTALQSLKDHVEDVRQSVDGQVQSLHVLIETIGVQDRLFDLDGDGSTMHSNLPILYRKELRGFTKDQLLNVLDVVSFEDGVVDAVGKAVRARKLSTVGQRTTAIDSVVGALLST